MKENSTILLVILVIIVIALLGGFKNTQTNNGFHYATFPNQGGTLNGDQANIQAQISEAQSQANDLQQQIQAQADAKVASQYKGIVTLNYPIRSTDPTQEYITIRVGNTTKPIDITGWTLTSTSTGNTVKIPQSTYLYFAGQPNPEQDVYVQSGDTIYIITGISPIGYSFKVNECSGYLSQFQNFTPGLFTNCPLPRNENLSSIPRSPNNDACLDYIQYFPQCRIQTDTLPLNWSYECTNFIYSKITYPSCVDTHKNDAGFYQNEWRIYLKRSDTLWKNSRENITLYDNLGKVVDRIYY